MLASFHLSLTISSISFSGFYEDAIIYSQLDTFLAVRALQLLFQPAVDTTRVEYVTAH